MSHRRRKHLLPQPEPEKQPALFFARKKEEAVPFFHTRKIKAQPVERQQVAVEAAQKAAMALVCDAVHLMRDSEPAAVIRQKALVWARRSMASGIRSVDTVLEALEQLITTLKNNRFLIAGVPGDRAVLLQQDFGDLNPSTQVTVLLKAAIRATALPCLDSAPDDDYQNKSRTDAWETFLVGLFALLPDKPLLIIGTSIHRQLEKPTEEERSRNTPLVRNWLRNLFRRRNQGG